MRPDFIFEGIGPHIRAKAASLLPMLGDRYVSTAVKLDPVVRIGQALSQATLAPPADREGIIRAVFPWRDSLAVALAGVDVAIADVMSELGLAGTVTPDHGDFPMGEDILSGPSPDPVGDLSVPSGMGDSTIKASSRRRER